MREHPFCKRCAELGRQELGEEVDHEVPLFKGGQETPENRQTLCKPHHDEKTLRDLGHTRRPTIGRDGWPVSPEEELALARRRRKGMRR